MPNTVRSDQLPAAKARAHEVRVALTGNPNAGKTSLFNALTGARQHVANYPGVTVEKKEGTCRVGETVVHVTDLPGTYSLTACSAEELIARNALLHGRPDVVVDILDACNLERNLYLAVQLLELGLPTVLALNMSDVAREKGIEFDLDGLHDLLGVPIIPTVGHKGIGREALLTAVVERAGRRGPSVPLRIDYGTEIESETRALELRIEAMGRAVPPGVPPRWLALKLIEGDSVVREMLPDAALIAEADAAARRIESALNDSPEAAIAERRYASISAFCRRTVRCAVEPRRSVSDRIDAVVTHRLLGLPIFLALMFLTFQLTFALGNPPMGWIESGFAWLGDAVGTAWTQGSHDLLRSLLVDGIIGGVGGVLVFLPNILLLFLAIAVLEDSGYMARAAFLMDRLMNKIGLHGKSFVPMLIGFGCSVPAIMATRTLESRRDRLTTMLVVPLMSCGARLPIYALIIPAFFPQAWQAPMLWLIYVIGIVLAILCAKLLKLTVLRGETPPFVMELPPYRMPTVRSVGLHMWNRGGAYLRKAGTIILGISILLWAMQKWPALPQDVVEKYEQQRQSVAARSDASAELKGELTAEVDHAEAEAALEHSLMGRIGRAIEPVLRPCGFDWKISTAMIGAFAAKEVFVSQMGIVYSLGQEQDEESESLRGKLRAEYSALQGFCIMLFCLISAPCMATIAVTRRESNSWGWALFQLAGLTVLAWIVTSAVWFAGNALGWGVGTL